MKTLVAVYEEGLFDLGGGGGQMPPLAPPQRNPDMRAHTHTHAHAQAQTQTQTQTQTDTDTDRHRHRHRHRQTQTDTHTHTHRVRHQTVHSDLEVVEMTYEHEDTVTLLPPAVARRQGKKMVELLSQHLNHICTFGIKYNRMFRKSKWKWKGEHCQPILTHTPLWMHSTLGLYYTTLT